MRASVVVSLLLLALSFASQARAEPEEASKVRDLFEDARRLMTAGDYQTAAERLEHAAALSTGRGIRYQLAVCHEKLGHVASAWTLYLQVADASRDAGERDRELVARTHAAALEARVPHLRLAVSDADATVERDGAPVPKDTWNAAVAVDPGKHAIRAMHEGRRPWETTIDLGEGASVEVVVPPLEAIPPPPSPPPPPPLLPPPHVEIVRKPPSTFRTAGVVVGSFGTAALAVGAGFVIASAATYAQAGPLCDALDHCSPSGAAIRGDALTYGDVATGLLIDGAVTLAVGVVLYLVAPKHRRMLAYGQ